MPIEWVGESLSSAYASGDTRPVDPANRSQSNIGQSSRDKQKSGADKKDVTIQGNLRVSCIAYYLA
jgi:hypothetical protein